MRNTRQIVFRLARKDFLSVVLGGLIQASESVMILWHFHRYYSTISLDAEIEMKTTGKLRQKAI